jgi:hypothetical protein
MGSNSYLSSAGRVSDRPLSSCIVAIYNLPVARLPGQIGPNPSQEDAHPTVALRQKLGVHGRPPKPRLSSLDVSLAALQDANCVFHLCAGRASPTSTNVSRSRCRLGSYLACTR